jgi:primary-amine oxidase
MPQCLRFPVQFWATAYKEKELFPAGDYPNSRGVKDGLPSWVNNESLVKKDVVVWYNLGITHIVRPEEWPIMNVHTLGFSLVPNGFFDRNNVAANKHSPETPNMIVSDAPKLPDVTVCVPLPKDKPVAATSTAGKRKKG